MPRVVHFEIHADDMMRAKKFYEEVFGWRFQEYEGPLDYWLVYTGEESQPGINGGLVQRGGALGGQGLNAFPCTVDVDDVDAYLQRVLDAGGQEAMGKFHVPGVGWVAYGIDTEGNTFGMMQYENGAQDKKED